MISTDPQAIALLPGAAALSRPTLSRFLNRARKLVGLEGEVELLLTSDAELKRLNRAFRNKNKATDILSFPAPSEISDHHAGDLAISLETAARQANQFSHTLSEELCILILHGLLHLSGLDHETDTGEMAAREAELHATLKLPVSLIARVTPTRPTAKLKESAPKKSKKSAPKKRAKGPLDTSQGQRPRSTSRDKNKRAESPTYKPTTKPAKKKARK